MIEYSQFYHRDFSYLSIVGCVRNIRVNNLLADLSKATTSSLGNDPPAPEPGCLREEECFPNPCRQGGKCLGGWVQHSCECPRDYTGQDCTEGKISH